MSSEDQQVSSDSEDGEENRALQPPDQVEEEILKDLCLRNGVSSDKIVRGLMKKSVPKIENFFSGHTQMIRYNFFPGLRELEIMSIPIDKIQGLSACLSLEKLWICECKIRTIEGVEKCKSLRKLYLYSNQIQRIQGISNLYNLNTLWLNNNMIRVIEGIDNLVSLKDLNLASNKIVKIGNSLKGHSNLESLNLSGNLLSSFKDLTHLVELSKLRFVGLKDPLYQSNPVCSLCNYSTHLLYHLPFLTHLDTFDISNGHLQKLAEATVQKKKMYYTMRVKMLQRNQAEMELRLQEERNKLVSLPYERVHLLTCCVRDIQRSRNDKEDSDVEHGNIVDKLLALETRIEHWTKEIDKVDVWHHSVRNSVKKEVKSTIGKLMLELECGGNVRLEEGQSGDIWYNSCAELVQSRFCSADYKSLGITGIKINRIYRIHNRILRQLFEEKLDVLLERESPADLAKYGLSDARIVSWKSVPYKRMLEYLFYIHNPNIEDSVGGLQDILETGFKDSNAYLDAGSDGCITLSNSLSLAEAPRIKYLKKKRERGEDDAVDPCVARHGQILICKTYIGNSEAAKDSHNPITKSSYPDCDSVYKTKDALPRSFCVGSGNCDCSSRQCIWYVFLKELVTPEYLVDYEYTTTPRFSPLYGSVSVCYSNGKEEVSIVQSSDNMLDELWKRQVENDIQVLELPPSYEQVQAASLQVGGIEKLSLSKQFGAISEINLHNQGLKRVRQLSAHPTLKKLLLSFNQLECLDDFHHMDSLEELDISFNGLTTLEGLRSLTSLHVLDISWNLLSISREEVHTMRKHTPSLQTLDMRHNPWSKREGLRVRVIGRLKGLTLLDGEMVREEELTQASHLASLSRISAATLQTCCKTDSAPPRTLDLISTAQCLHNRLVPGKVNEIDALWWSKVTSLCLDDQHICKLSNLDKLENLQWASFENNEIAKIEGLDSCNKLEELSLAGNCISKVEGLARLTKLQVLRLSSNLITSLEGAGLEKLTKLWHISLENNKLQTLLGLQIPSLIEVYVGNNNIQSSHDVFMLKSLPSLLILDMYGNPIVSNMTAYRSFVIYHLKSLRALDGSAIESSEVATAKENYGGRLCEDFIAEHLGHSNFLEVREIDFPNLSIRIIDLGNGTAFKNLRSINLEGNALASFGGLVCLENVKVLCLNHNHIESLSGKVPSSSKSREQQPPPPDITPVLQKLEVLHLGYNSISNLCQLQLFRIPNLKSLFLQGNEIVSVEGLGQAKELRELVLDRNKIKNLSETSFCDQWNLLELHIEENRLKSLSNFHPLQKLQRLYLGMNRIQDLAELEKLECLPALKEMSLTNNPVARRLMHRPLLVFRQPNLLSIDGIPISAEERAKADMYFLDYQDQSQPVEQTTSTNLPGISSKLHGVAGGISQVSAQSNPIRGAPNLPLGANQTWYGNYRESDNVVDKKNDSTTKKSQRERNFYLDPQNSTRQLYTRRYQ